MSASRPLYWTPYHIYGDQCPQHYLWRFGWPTIDLGNGPGRPKKPPTRRSRHDAVMGIAIQAVLEKFYNDEIWRGFGDNPERVRQMLRAMSDKRLALELHDNYIDWNQSPTREEMLKIVRDGVFGYLKTMKAHRLLGEYARSEVNLVGNINRYESVGSRVDFLIRRADHVTILDGKNSKDKDAKHISDDQIRWHALCFYLGFGKMPNRGGFVFYRYPADEETDEKGIRWVDFTKQDFTDLSDRALAAKTGMRKEEFGAKPTSNACRYCDYKECCPEYKAKRAENAAKRAKHKVPIVEGEEDEGFFDLDIDAFAAKTKAKKEEKKAKKK